MVATLLAIFALHLGSPEALIDSRLRTTDAKTAALIAFAVDGSITLRGLVAEIESGDAIVHVSRENFLPGRLSGRMKLVGRAGGSRYVRIIIDAELQPRLFAAALAHELQHVSELIANRDVNDEASMAMLYRRIGHEYRVNGQTAFETEAARRMGIDVLREMLAPRPAGREITTTVQFARGARER
jgi:hypothetical protein